MFKKNNERELAECLDLISSGKQNFTACVEKYPHIKDELEMAVSLQKEFSLEEDRSITQIQRRKQKTKILANLPDRDLSVTKLAKPRYTLQNLKRRFAMSWIIIISTIVTLVSGGGIVYASGDALPGEVLYPVKTWVEDVRLAAASDEADVGLQFKFAEKRLEEIEALVEAGELDDVDLAVLGYGNQTKLLTQTMAKIKSEDPEEAVRLRLELETKLQEQARRMEDLLDESEASDEFVQDRVRLMLQTNTQLRERIREADEEPDEVETVEGEGTTEEEPAAESAEEASPGGNQNQNGKGDVSAEIDGDAGAFKFNLGGQGENGVYAMIDGTRFECAVDGDQAICPAEGAPNKGEVCLYDAQTNQMLFTFAYEHSFEHAYGWQGEKNDNGNNGSQGDGDGDGDGEGSTKENTQNNTGK